MADDAPRSPRRRRHAAPGTAPGLLTADPGAHPSRFRVLAYGPDAVEEGDNIAPAALADLRARFPMVWVDVDGLQDIEAIRSLGQVFDLHGLALEDVVNVHQRPKAEDYADSLFVVLRMPATGPHVETEQMSIFIGDGFVVTFQERPGDWFEPVRQRLRDPRARVRQRGGDYLAYALIDAVVDAFFPLLEDLGERLEDLEQEIMEDPRQEHVPRIHGLRRDLLTVRRAAWPMRELLNGLLRDPHPHIDEGTRVFLRDCYDHTVQIMDVVDTSREMVAGLIDMHLSAVNNRMNEIMKVLTVIATIFIPLSFIASLYGMNFDTAVSPWNMPELHWTFGYPFALSLMIATAGGLLWFFRRRGWLGDSRRARRRRDPG